MQEDEVEEETTHPIAISHTGTAQNSNVAVAVANTDEEDTVIVDIGGEMIEMTRAQAQQILT